jgi:hypothetical protein
MCVVKVELHELCGPRICRWRKPLRAFDRKRLPRKVDAHVNVLLEGAFLDQCENVLAFGQPGSGKTHLLMRHRLGTHLR